MVIYQNFVSKKLVVMISDKLKLAIEEIQKRLEIPDYLKSVCSIISVENANLQTIKKILNDHNVNTSKAKVDFLNLVFEYIKIALEDNILTIEEKYDVHYLKLLFQIQPGDFYIHNRWQLEKVIAYQLSNIYRDDFVNEQEALLKVDIQELFDLSYDQMNEFTKKRASASILKGVDFKDLDVFFPPEEYFKLKST